MASRNGRAAKSGRNGIALACMLAGALVLQGCDRPEAAPLAAQPAAEKAAVADTTPPAPAAVEPAAAPAAVTPAASTPVQAARAPAIDAISDPAITARVSESLRADPAMAGADVSVTTDHGVVNLAGRVKSAEQAAIATLHAQNPDGVMRIESHLAVEAG